MSRRKNPDTELTSQYLQNRSYDPEFDVSVVEMLGYDAGSGQLVRLAVNSDGELPISATVVASDIQIGAVEIKDSSTDQRQTVHTSGAASVKELRSSTGTITSVSDTASSTTLLASNTSRLGGSIYNDSTAILYVKLGATASTTSFTTKVYPEELYEIPGNYTGIIDAIWNSDAGGSARITELT